MPKKVEKTRLTEEERKEQIVGLLKNKKLNYRAWAELISYYRYYMDKFIIEILGVKLYPFQRFIIRACARSRNILFLASRGLGKSFLLSVFAVAYALLYPGAFIGITSKTGKQARMVIIKKIKNELMAYPNIANEISAISTSVNETNVKFKNGSSIFAITLGQSQGGEGARGDRCHLMIVDEARIVKDSVIAEVIEPMTKNKRPNLLEAQRLFPDKEIYERNKIAFMSSAYLKTCDLYKRFMLFYSKMKSGDRDFFVVALDYKVGEQSGIFFKGEIEKEKEKPEVTQDIFTYEYKAVFVGSSNSSYYPYSITQKSRILIKPELKQPKVCQTQYVLMHDVAVSGVKGSDNCATHIIKLKEKGDGTYIKSVVYSKTQNGIDTGQQRDFIRELYHIKFPNIIKIVIDAQSIGEGLLSQLREVWCHDNEKGETIEYPPLIVDDNQELVRQMPNAVPIIKAVHASQQFNINAFSYTRACFENGTLQLLTDSHETDEDYKMGEMTVEEQSVHIEHDYLVQELSNIVETIGENGGKVYRRIVPKQKRDRATSLVYGMEFISELETESKSEIYNHQSDYDISAYLGFF